MSRAHYLSSAAAFALLAGVSLGAAPALADVTVTATVEKTKTVTVIENLEKNKFVNFNVTLDEEVESGSETLAIVNQRIGTDGTGNGVDSTGAQNAQIQESVTDNSGSTNVNNAAGFFNQQGNVLSATINNLEEDDGSFAEVQASVEQIIEGNTQTASGNNNASNNISVLNNTGVTQVNNAAGVSNEQVNVTAFASAFAEADEPGIALDESDLGQTLALNNLTVGAASNTATITASVVGNTGVTNVNNVAGAMNQQANVVEVAAMSANAFIPVTP